MPAFNRAFRAAYGMPPAAYRQQGRLVPQRTTTIPEDITVGSLDRPEDMPPTLHYWDSRRLPWLHLGDDLPRYPELPPEG